MRFWLANWLLMLFASIIHSSNTTSLTRSLQRLSETLLLERDQSISPRESLLWSTRFSNGNHQVTPCCIVRILEECNIDQGSWWLEINGNGTEMFVVSNDLELRSLIQEIETLNGIQLKTGSHVLSDSNLDAQEPFLLLSKPLSWGSCQRIWQCITPTFPLLPIPEQVTCLWTCQRRNWWIRLVGIWRGVFSKRVRFFYKRSSSGNGSPRDQLSWVSMETPHIEVNTLFIHTTSIIW